jgi:small subunit ribosomal protein S6
MREYEVLFIVHPEYEGDRLKEVLEKFTGVVTRNGGEVLKVDEWGKQKLAYPVAKCAKGQYVLMDYLGPAALVSELERNLRLDEIILKYLTVKLADRVDPEKRRQEIAAARAKAEAQSFRPATGEAPRSAAGGAAPPETGKAPPETGKAPPETGKAPPETGKAPPETGEAPS